MSLLNMFKRTDINAGVDEFRNTQGAVLLDVRTKEEYNDGHIEGSINIPLQNIYSVQTAITVLDKPVFVHCLSGGRSAQATSILKSMGYKNVENIGGISSFRGEIVR